MSLNCNREPSKPTPGLRYGLQPLGEKTMLCVADQPSKKFKGTWIAFEALGVEPAFAEPDAKRKAIDYACQRFGGSAGEVYLRSSRVIGFNGYDDAANRDAIAAPPASRRLRAALRPGSPPQLQLRGFADLDELDVVAHDAPAKLV